MKLYFSDASPYARKVMVVAHETGQAGKVEKLAAKVSPVARDPSVTAVNPIGKVPTAILDDGEALYDSRVICRYLDAGHDGAKLYPEAGPACWAALRWEALADGLLDAALLARYEVILRPEDKQWPDWRRGQMDKIAACLDLMESEIAGRTGEGDPAAGTAVDIGLIAAGCALGYLDFRFSDFDWRAGHPGLAGWFAVFGERPSMRETRPKG